MIRSIANVYRAAFAGLPRDVWLLSIAALVNRAGTMVLPFIALYLTQSRGFPVTVAGRVLGLYGLGSMLGSWLGGWASDRIGAVRTQIISLLLGGAGILWLGSLESVLWISIAAFLVSVVAEALRPAVMAATAQLAPPDQQVRAFALLRLAVNVGMGIGPAAAGTLALRGYGWLFVVDAVTCWLAAGMLVASFRGRGPLVRAHTGPDAAGSPWRDGPFLLLLLLVIGLATAFFQINSTLPVYYRQHYGFLENTIGVLLALNALLIVAFEMVLIHWAERRDRLFLIGVGTFLTCAGFALMPLGSTVGFVAFTIVVWTLGEMLALPLMNAVVAGRAPGGSQGRYMGMFTMAFSAAFIFAPAVGTWVYERFGPDTLWYGIGLAGALMWAGALALRRLLRG